MNDAFERLMDQLNSKGYHHPRTAKEHSNVLSKLILDDLVENCPKLLADFESGSISYQLDVNVSTGISDHTIDLVIGPPIDKLLHGGISEAPLNIDEFRIVIEHKSVITAHRNNKNRLRDMKEFAKHAFDYRSDVIICGTMMVGTALSYLSVETVDRILKAMDEINRSDYWRSKMCKDNDEIQIKFEKTQAITQNRSMDPEKSFNLYKSEIPIRNNPEDYGFDAFVITPVQIDNIAPCRVNSRAFGERNDEFTYDQFIKRISEVYVERF